MAGFLPGEQLPCHEIGLQVKRLVVTVEVRRVQRVVQSRLAAGQRPTLRATARDLQISPRTLQRRLDDRGLSFTVLLARAEAQRACHLLRNQTLHISEISRALGYRDPSSFSRAFRHWTGVSPREYRSSPELI